MRVAVFAAILLFSLAAHAVEPGEILPDPAQESRARAISANLRCMVCKGQDIDSSGSDLAADLRHLIREKITAGATDDEIYAFARERYGDAVLMTPPREGKTALLWLAPVAFFVCGLGIVMIHARRKAD
jgi:cytochrome c-type biogenesis protein CcmH